MSKGNLRLPIIVVLLLMASIFMVVRLDPINAQSTFETRLYLNRENRYLKTQPPQLSTGDPPTQTLTVGNPVTYTMPYPATDTLTLDGPLDSGMTIMELHLEASFVTPGSTDVVLTVELREIDSNGEEEIIGSLDLDQSDLGVDDFDIPINGPHELEKGSNLILELNITEGQGPLGSNTVFSFQYSSVGGENSYLQFLCDPVPAGGVTLGMLDIDGNPISGILPNGPAEARTVQFNCGVKDLFGAYDVSSINLKVTSPTGSQLLNLTEDQPENRGGQEWTYYNQTEELPESLPVGTYNVSVTGRSHTGFNRTARFDLEVSEGLHVSLEGESGIEADAGESLVVGVKVINGGGSTDRVSFDYAGGGGWKVTPPEDSDIEAGSSVPFEYTVKVPIDAGLGDIEDITLIVNSRNAGKDYAVMITVEVMSEATFGIEVSGQSSKALNPGMSGGFLVNLVNLKNETETFELEGRDLPLDTDLEITGGGGSQQGSYFTVELGPDRSVTLSVNVSVGFSAPGGSHRFRVTARVQGGDEIRSVYLSILVVDPSRDILSLPSGISERTASRSGSSSPVEYEPVSFSLNIYNPTLEEVDLSVSVEAPAGWDYDSDYATASLLPGTESDFNVSVTPSRGELWNGGEGYDVTVSVSGSGLRRTDLDLEVKLPEIRGIALKLDQSLGVVEVMSGKSRDVNLTVSNDGNRMEDVTLTVGETENLKAILDQDSISQLEPGQEVKLYVTVEAEEVQSDKVLQVDVEADMGDYQDDISFQVQVKAESSSLSISPLAIVAIVLGVIVVALAGIFIYSRFVSGNRVKEGSATEEKPQKRPKVTVTAEDKPLKGEREVRPPPDREVLSEADLVTMEILGDQGSNKEPEGEKEVTASVLE